MKGLKIDFAKPSNAIDIYALLKEAAKEGLLAGKPSERQLKAYYFTHLLPEVGAPGQLYLVAKRGRGYLGFLHASLITKWGTSHEVVVHQIFVVKHRRKNGVGRKLLDELQKQVENLGIKRIEFACPLDQVEYWAKERKAKSSQAIMGVDL